MKKKLLFVAIAIAVVLTGFSVYQNATDLKGKLIKTWAHHTPEDEAYQEKFIALVSMLGQHSPEVRAKLDSYKEQFKISEDSELYHLIFLMRRMVDVDSFYTGLDRWSRLSEHAKAKIIPHFGPTYKEVTSATIAQNKELAALLQKRESNRHEVLENLPASFKALVRELDSNEVDGYLGALDSLMQNTLKVMEYLKITDEPKDEL